MNPEVKQKWVDALRSGKYSQDKGFLRSTQGHCCLGVLCDLYAQEHNIQWEFVGNDKTIPLSQDYWCFDSECDFLPNSVKNWAGLNSINPEVIFLDEGRDYPVSCLVDLASLNDEDISFSEIADLIEQHL